MLVCYTDATYLHLKCIYDGRITALNPSVAATNVIQLLKLLDEVFWDSFDHLSFSEAKHRNRVVPHGDVKGHASDPKNGEELDAQYVVGV